MQIRAGPFQAAERGGQGLMLLLYYKPGLEYYKQSFFYFIKEKSNSKHSQAVVFGVC